MVWKIENVKMVFKKLSKKGKSTVVIIVMFILLVSVISLINFNVINNLVSAEEVDNTEEWNLDNFEQPKFFNGTNWVKLNRSFKEGSFNGYDYKTDSAPYTLYVKENSNWGDGIKYCVYDNETEQEYCMTYQAQDMSYKNEYGSQDYISSIQNSQVKIQNNVIKYNNTFPNVDLVYENSRSGVKEKFVLKEKLRNPNLDAETLDFGGYVKFPNLDMYVNNSKITSDFITKQKIELRKNNKTLFSIPKPIAYDSNESEINLTYEVEFRNNQIWFYIKTPYDWLNNSNRVYPIYIDPAWDIESYTYDSISLNAQGVQPKGLFWKSDGTKFYEVDGKDNSGKIFQYKCTTAWDLSSCSHDGTSINTESTLPRGLFWKPDGTKFYSLDRDHQYIHEYSCNEAWNLSTCSYDLRIDSRDYYPMDISFKDDGTKFYEIGRSDNEINQYSCTNAWDLSSCSYDGISLSVDSEGSQPTSIHVKPDGTKMFTTDYVVNKMFQYSCTNAWDLSSCSYDNKNINTQGDYPWGIFINDDGNKLFNVDYSNKKIYQYSAPLPNTAPNKPTNPTPSDEATGVSTTTSLSTYLTDPDGDTMNASFYWNNDTLIETVTGVTNGSTATTNSLSLNGETTYNWYVNVTDGSLTNQSDTWNFTTEYVFPGSGSGTDADPYQITTCDELNETRNKLTASYILMNDINFSECDSSYTTGKGWLPIGKDISNYWQGNFNGNNNTISNLYINRSGYDYIGLFGTIGWSPSAPSKTIEIKNLKLENLEYYIEDGFANGGLFGEYSLGTDFSGTSLNINNVSVQGEINALDNGDNTDWGGFFGVITNTNPSVPLTIKNSYADVDIYGNATDSDGVGGFIGTAWEVEENAIFINNTYSTGKIYAGDNTNQGGFLGHGPSSSNITINNSFWDINTSNQTTSVIATGKTTSEMQSIETFNDTSTEGLDTPWNITTVSSGETDGSYIWNIIDGSTYPFLSFEEARILVDTCSCPGTDTNWELDLSDNCIIQSDCNIGTGNITFINTGNVTFNSTITACKIGQLPSNQIGYLGEQAKVNQGGSC